MIDVRHSIKHISTAYYFAEEQAHVWDLRVVKATRIFAHQLVSDSCGFLPLCLGPKCEPACTLHLIIYHLACEQAPKWGIHVGQRGNQGEREEIIGF